MAGFVYVFSNPSYPELLKIGKSSSDPSQKRILELDTTGVPTPFRCEYFAFIEDYHEAEFAVHEYLDVRRTRKQREFFAVSVKEAINAIHSCAKVIYERYHNESDLLFADDNALTRAWRSLPDASEVLVPPTHEGIEESSAWFFFMTTNSRHDEIRKLSHDQRQRQKKKLGFWAHNSVKNTDELLIIFAPSSARTESFQAIDIVRSKGSGDSETRSYTWLDGSGREHSSVRTNTDQFHGYLCSSETSLVKRIPEAIEYIRGHGGGFFKLRCDLTTETDEKRIFLALTRSPYIESVRRLGSYFIVEVSSL